MLRDAPREPLPIPRFYTFVILDIISCSGPAWSSDVLGDMVTYGVVISGTAGWLERWTTPLLGSNPVIWAVLYALGLSVPERQPSFAYSLQANGNDAAEIVLVQNPTVDRSELSFSKGISVLFQRMFVSLPEETNAGLGEGAGDTGAVDSPGVSLSRPMLVAGWLLALAAVVPAVPMVTERFGLSKVQSRKVFHVLATAMFVPAVALQVRKKRCEFVWCFNSSLFCCCCCCYCCAISAFSGHKLW